jgi:hypothetical protein
VRSWGVVALWGVGALLSVAVSGCSHEEGDDLPSPDATAEVAAGSVTGTFRASGGPYPGVDRPLHGTVTFDGPVHRDVTPDADGTFTLDLPPGTYQVVGHPSGRSNPTTCPSDTTTVATERVSTVQVGCYYE